MIRVEVKLQDYTPTLLVKYNMWECVNQIKIGHTQNNQNMNKDEDSEKKKGKISNLPRMVIILYTLWFYS